MTATPSTNPPTPPPTPLGPPSSWLIPAIMTTLCCMPLTGVVAVAYAAGVHRAWRAGDVERATRLARRARMWVFIGFFCFLAAVTWAIASGSGFTLIEEMRT